MSRFYFAIAIIAMLCLLSTTTITAQKTADDLDIWGYKARAAEQAACHARGGIYTIPSGPWFSPQARRGTCSVGSGIQQHHPSFIWDEDENDLGLMDHNSWAVDKDYEGYGIWGASYRARDARKAACEASGGYYKIGFTFWLSPAAQPGECIGAQRSDWHLTPPPHYKSPPPSYNQSWEDEDTQKVMKSPSKALVNRRLKELVDSITRQ